MSGRIKTTEQLHGGEEQRKNLTTEDTELHGGEEREKNYGELLTVNYTLNAFF